MYELVVSSDLYLFLYPDEGLLCKASGLSGGSGGYIGSNSPPMIGMMNIGWNRVCLPVRKFLVSLLFHLEFLSVCSIR
jgi:hypothetical protein